jgi:glycosyltransferase involved in cell wall biosynthesis
MKSDFSIFIRPDRRSSHAGFPTKLAESMIAGTPVITNNTGDIGQYLKNGKEGFLLKSGYPEELKDIFLHILSLSREKLNEMRLNARRMAEESFDYRVYCGEMKSFIERVKHSYNNK